MNNSKASGPSGIASEILKASVNRSSEQIAHLLNAIIKENKTQSDWNDSYIISLIKGKGSVNEFGNCSGLKLTELVLKLIEHVRGKYLRDLIKIDEMQLVLCEEFV